MRIFTFVCAIVFSALSLNLNGQCPTQIFGPDEICEGTPLTMTVSDGSGFFPSGSLITWSNGSQGPDVVIPDLTPGNYNYNVFVQIPGCAPAFFTHAVTVNPNPVVTFSNVSDATCGQLDGTATASVPNGASYIWSDGHADVTGVRTDMRSGTYTVTATDNNGCTGTGIQVIGNNGATDISGFVYGDFDYNGIHNQLLQPYANVPVSIFDDNGLVASTTTGPDGTYNFPNVDFTQGQIYRLEFNVDNGIYAPYYVTNESGTDNLQVRFIDGPNCNANLGIAVPTDYCHTDDPTYVVPCYVNGKRTNADVASMDVIVSTNYLNTGIVGQGGVTVNHDATVADMGSVWGVAYDRLSKEAYFGAFLKRHVDLGPGGLGQIYSIDYSSGVGGAITPWVDISTFGPLGDPGTIDRTSPGNELGDGVAVPAADPDAFGKIGKVGIGDVDVSDDGQTLYVTNLNTKTILGINTVTGNLVSSTPTAGLSHGCAGEWQPFALKYYGGALYFGGVCSNGLQAYIYKEIPGTGIITEVLNFPLTYTRTGDKNFGPWDDTYPVNTGLSQPMLVDIEFEVDGAMIIGLRDRTGDQWGSLNYAPDGTPASPSRIISPGDVLRADPNGDALGTYTLESNGITSTGITGCGSGNMHGPNGGEFFCGDLFLGHNETVTGGLAKFAGSGEVSSAVIDPLRAWSQGIARLSIIDGSAVTENALELIQYNSNSVDGFGKANGLGDIEVFCDPAPLEVGNYVWIDADNNGVQDPGETPMAGITIGLYDAAGNPVQVWDPMTMTNIDAVAVTDADGYYYFNSDDYLDQNGATVLTPVTSYYLAVVDPYGPNGLTYNGSDFVVTMTDVGGNSFADDERDNDATSSVTNPIPTQPMIAFSTGAPGQHNHSLDFGFFGCSLVVSTGNDVPFCNGDPQLTLTANVQNATGDIVFLWTDDQGGLPSSGPTKNVTPNVTTCYTVKATDQLGCEGEDEICVVVENPPVLQTIIPNLLCADEAGVFSVTNPDPTYNYVWNFNGGTTADGDSNDPTETVSWGPAFQGQTITVTLNATSNELGCPASAEFEVQIGGPVSAEAGPNKTICPATCAEIGGTMDFVAPDGGVISWSPATNLSATDIPNPEVCIPANAAMGTSITYTLTVTNNGCTTTDEVVVTIDECLLSIGSTVFEDPDDSGTQDPGEGGISGVLVQVYSAGPNGIFEMGGGDDVLEGSDTTDGNGDWIVSGLDPGQYQVVIPTPDANFPDSSTPTDFADNQQDGDDNGDQATSGGKVHSPVITLTPNNEPTLAAGNENNDTGGQQDDGNDPNGDMTIDFGFIPACETISGIVWQDNNSDGCQDLNEVTLANYTITAFLCDANGNPTNNIATQSDGTPATEVTGNDGAYEFCLNPSETYSIGISGLAADESLTGKDSNNCGDTEDSDSNPNGKTDCTPTGPDDIDFGIVPPCETISGVVWFDTDADGCQEAGEVNLQGYTITAFECDGNGAPTGTVATQSDGTPAIETTNNAGAYEFCLDPSKEYAIQISGLAADEILTIQDSNTCGNTTDSDADPNGMTSCTPTGPDDIDFGIIPNCETIDGVVFGDLNDSGCQDNNEITLPGYTITAFECVNGVPTGTIATDVNTGQPATTVTGNDGAYEFCLDPTKEYVIGISGLGVDESLSDKDVAGCSESDDSDANPNGQTDCTPTGTCCVDFGIIPPCETISGIVFMDADDNGCQDAGEAPIAGKTITAFECINGVPTGTVAIQDDGTPAIETVGNDGAYDFCLDPSKEYVLSISGLTANETLSDKDVAACGEADDSDSNPNGQTDCTPTNTTDVDFGIVPELVSIGSTVFVDNNDDGMLNGADAGIPGVLVELLDANGNVVDFMNTDANGNYFFDMLMPGIYQVRIPNPDPAYPNSSTPTDNMDNNQDNDDNGVQNTPGGSTISPPIDLQPGQEVGNNVETGPGANLDDANENNGNMTVDFGFVPTCETIDGVVFMDTNDNGCQDNNETPVSGVTITAFECVNGIPTGTIATDANTGQPAIETVGNDGAYEFCLDPSKEYVMGISGLTADQSLSDKDAAGCGESDDSDANPNGQTDCTPTGTCCVDFGIVPELVSIGSTVFVDNNDDGMLNGADAGIPGVLVELLDANGNVVDFMNTDANGNYFFDMLMPGIYQVRIPNPDPAYPNSSTPTDNMDNNQDNDDNGVQNTPGGSTISPPIDLQPGQEVGNNVETGPGANLDDANENNGNMTVDFGFVPTCETIDGVVFYDTNDNGCQDNNETPAAGYTVTAFECVNGVPTGTIATDANTGQPATETVGNDGAYEFCLDPSKEYVMGITGLAAGESLADKDAAGCGESDDSDANPNGQTDCTPTGTCCVDFGIVPPCETIDGVVFADTNDSGCQDNGESPLSGYTITAFECINGVPTGTVATDVNTGQPAVETTSDDGAYEFCLDPTKEYVLAITGLAAGESLSDKDVAGCNESDDSDANPNGQTDCTPTNTCCVDFGIVPPCETIDGVVFMDTNDSGCQDNGESPAAGYTITAFECVNGVPTNTVATDVNTGQPAVETTGDDGAYEFCLDPSKEYVIGITGLAAGESLSDKDVAGCSETDDSDANPNGQTDCTPTGTCCVDFGIVPPCETIDGVVFEDSNMSDCQDNNEQPLAGYTITAFECVNGVPTTTVATDVNTGQPATTVTGDDGAYEFCLDPSKEYVIGISGLAADEFLSGKDAAGCSDADDSDANPNGMTDCTPTGTCCVDFGIQPEMIDLELVKSTNASLVTVGIPFQFSIDVTNRGPANATGVDIQDVIPSGYDLSTVANISNGGVLTGNTIDWIGLSINNGQTITLTFDIAVAWPLDPNLNNVAEVTDHDQTDVDSTPGNGADTDGDGDIGPIDNDGSQDPDDEDDGDDEEVFVGGFPANWGNISGHVDEDTDGNGTGDTPIPGVVIELLYPDGTPTGLTATTDMNGFYQFTNVPPGNYILSEQQPTGLTSVSDDDTTPDDPNDNDGVVDDEILVTVNPFENDDDNDFVEVVPAGLGDFVWMDEDNDGIQDPNEDGINGVTVNLYEDANNDGIPDTPGTPDATTTTMTNGGNDGYYEFTGLIPGNYIVEFVTPANHQPTVQDATGGNTDGTDPGDDSDADPTTGLSHTVVLSPGEFDDEIDAGFFEELSLGDLVWEDSNNDGIKDPTESGVANVTLTLWEDTTGDGLPDTPTGMTTSTDGNGNYSFTGLAPGDYVVQIDASNFGPGAPLEDWVTSDGNDVLGTAPDSDDDVNGDDNGYDAGASGILSQAVTLASGSEPTNDGDASDNSNLSVDFGVYPTASLGNFVWEDQDGDGVQDPGEPGINGITVTLYDAAGNQVGTPVVTMTDPNNPGNDGWYEFTDLAPGSYYVEFTTPAGSSLMPTTPNAVGNEADESDLDGSNGPNTTALFTLTAGQDEPRIDAGFFEPAQLGNFVWFDDGTNPDSQDGTDVPADGITVNLLDGNGNPVIDMTTGLPVTTTTDPTGEYRFTNLAPGDYQVEFVLPGGFTPVTPNFGSDLTDSDGVPNALGTLATTGTYTLTSGQTNDSVDLGLRSSVVPVTLTDFYGVWNEVRDVNELTWITESELNNDMFVIERSYGDNDNFVEIGTQEGNGTTNTTSTYNFDDADIQKNGIYYYRLKQLDFDGTATLSNEIAIRVERATDIDINIYPNPAIDQVNLTVEAGIGETVSASVYDVRGRLVSDQLFFTTTTSNTTTVSADVSNMDKGIYIVRVKVGKATFIKKLEILK